MMVTILIKFYLLIYFILFLEKKKKNLSLVLLQSFEDVFKALFCFFFSLLIYFILFFFLKKDLIICIFFYVFYSRFFVFFLRKILIEILFFFFRFGFELNIFSLKTFLYRHFGSFSFLFINLVRKIFIIILPFFFIFSVNYWFFFILSIFFIKFSFLDFNRSYNQAIFGLKNGCYIIVLPCGAEKIFFYKKFLIMSIVSFSNPVFDMNLVEGVDFCYVNSADLVNYEI